MKMDTVSRRLDLLKMEGEGFTKTEIVNGLSKKYQCTPRNIYLDYQKRGEWQPKLMEVKDRQKILMKAANRFESIYQKAAFKNRHAQGETVQLGALNTMLKANKDWLETLLPDLRSQIKVEGDLVQKPNVIVEMWRPEKNAEVSRE